MGVILHLQGQNLLRKAEKLEERLFSGAQPAAGLLRTRLSAGEEILPILCCKGANCTYHNSITPEGLIRLSPSNSHIVTAFIQEYLHLARAACKTVPVAILVREGLFWGHATLHTDRARPHDEWLLQLKNLHQQAVMITYRDQVIKDMTNQGQALSHLASAIKQAPH